MNNVPWPMRPGPLLSRVGVHQQWTRYVLRLKNGDISGLETLIARYQVKAVRTAYFIVHDKQLAEDIVQDAFIRVYQRIREFDESRPFEPYLMRSVIKRKWSMAHDLFMKYVFRLWVFPA